MTVENEAGETDRVEPLARWDLRMTLGECVTWDARPVEGAPRGRWLWTDIETRRLYTLSGELGAQPRSVDLPHRLASFGLTADPYVLLAAFDYGLAWLDLRDQSVRTLAEIEADRPETRLNDGRVDREGRFWVGSMLSSFHPYAPPAGSLYCYDGDRLHTVRTGIRIPNSLAFSADGAWMYFSDSRSFTIGRAPLHGGSDMPETTSGFATLSGGLHADGSAVDADGGLWNAQWGGGVVRYAPDGARTLQLTLPTLQPTCVGLGGPDMDQLLVVCATLDGPPGQDPEADGSALLFRTDRHAVPEPLFRVAPPL